MPGIFLIICLIVYAFIRIKVYYILKDDSFEPVELNGKIHTFKVCYRAVKLTVLSHIVMLAGYLSCISPYLFIEGIETEAYITGIISFGLFPVFIIAYICYSCMRGAHGSIRISTEGIEYIIHKSYSVKPSDIKTMTRIGPHIYQIRLKEKGKRLLNIHTASFYNRKEIQSLMKQLRDYITLASGQENNHPCKTSYFFLGCGIFSRLYLALVKIGLVLVLLYTSYCCIDYDFFRKDYTAEYNALYSDPSQPENAWDYYVQAAVNYVELDKEFQDILDDITEPNQFSLTDNQKEIIKQWIKDNSTSWENLKQTVSIRYCNATYADISSLENSDRDDFSSPNDSGYNQIKYLYSNINMACMTGILDIDWFDLFKMQLVSSKHFINGKSIIDQLVGYAMLHRAVDVFVDKGTYEVQDLQKVRGTLSEYFSNGVPPLSVEGEILMFCSLFDDMINRVDIPIQTPLNPMFLGIGSTGGTEEYIRKRYNSVLEDVQTGIEVETENFSFLSFPVMRDMLVGIFEPSISKVYRISQRTDTTLSVAYVILDLEEFKLTKGYYPEEIQHLSNAGLPSELPDDSNAEDSIIYSNDGSRAILYAVGRNGKDDGGYRDPKKSDGERDDIIFWERKSKEISETEK